MENKSDKNYVYAQDLVGGVATDEQENSSREHKSRTVGSYSLGLLASSYYYLVLHVLVLLARPASSSSTRPSRSSTAVVV